MTNTKDKSESNYQALLKELQASKDHFQYIRKKDGKALDDALAQIAALQADLDAANSGWISVEDRVPELSTHVIIHYEELEVSIVAEAFYFMDAFRVQGELVKPLNWMPLPNPQTDKEQGTNEQT